MKVRKYVRRFIDIYKKPVLKPSTYDTYILLIKHIPKDWKLDKVKIKDVQKLINNMTCEGFSRSTIKQTVTLLNMAFKRAYLDGDKKDMFNIDYCEFPPNNAKIIHGLTQREQQLLISRRRDSAYGGLFCFLLWTGCRISEALALNWVDYNALDRTIMINKTLYKGKIQPPKTKNGNRELPLSGEVVELLEEMRHTEGAATIPIFTNTLGKRCDRFCALQAFQRYTDLIGIPRYGLHALRHSFASNALRAGVNPKIVSKLLGHSSVQVTLDIYTDVYQPQLAEAAQRINESIFEMLD